MATKAAAATAAAAVSEVAAAAAATSVPSSTAATAAMAVPAMVVEPAGLSRHLLPQAYVPFLPMQPLEEYSCHPILDRTAQFAVHGGFCPVVAPLLLHHVASTVYGAEFAESVVTLTAANVDYMFHVFWNSVVTREEIFFRMVTRPANSGIVRVRITFQRHKQRVGRGETL